MYKIVVKYTTNYQGIYEEEIITASDLYELKNKYSKLIDKWFKRLVPHVDFNKYIVCLDYNNKLYQFSNREDIHNEIKIQLIKQTLLNIDYFDNTILNLRQQPERKFEIYYNKML